jgi:hypothetical protein
MHTNIFLYRLANAKGLRDVEFSMCIDICEYIHMFACMYSPANAKGLRDVEEALFSISLLDHPVPQAGAPGQTPDPGYIVTGDFLRESVLGKGGGGGQDGWRRGGELAETRIDMKVYAREVLCLGGGGGVGGCVHVLDIKRLITSVVLIFGVIKLIFMIHFN